MNKHIIEVKLKRMPYVMAFTNGLCNTPHPTMQCGFTFQAYSLPPAGNSLPGFLFIWWTDDCEPAVWTETLDLLNHVIDDVHAAVAELPNLPVEQLTA